MIYNSSKKEYKTPTCEFFGIVAHKVICGSYLNGAGDDDDYLDGGDLD